MKKSLCGFLAVFFLILNIIPSFSIYADSGYSDSQYEDIGSLVLASLLANGEATELDFSDYTGDDTDLLLAIGEMAVTGDVTGLVELGLSWLGNTIENTYDDLISYIKQWEYSIAPDLYNYWYNGENIRIDRLPTKHHSIDFSKLLIPTETPSPSPIPEELAFIRNINNLYIYTYNSNVCVSWFDFGTWHANYHNINPNQDLRSCSYLFNPNQYPAYNTHYSDRTFNDSNHYTYFMISDSVIDIEITTNQDNSVSVSYTYPNFVTVSSVFPQFGNGGNNKIMKCTYADINNNPAIYMDSIGGSYYMPDALYSSLTIALNDIFSKMANVNIKVDGEDWVVVSNTNYPIIIPSVVTVLNDLPTSYKFPIDTFIDLTDLKNIFINALRNLDIISWSDIKDVFVDINGQTAVAVLEIHDNNYDEMYLWQYPYILLPSNGYDYNVFNPNLLNEVSNNLNVPIDIVDNTVGILPRDIVGVLAIGGILTIFGCIIHRLLE